MKQLMKLMKTRHDFYVKYPELGATHLHLLEHLAICDQAGMPLMVTEARSLSAVASPASISRHLNDLEVCDLIQKIYGPDNNRDKYLCLTARGMAYFKRLNKVMEAA